MGHILKIPYYINIQKFEDIPHPKFETLLAPSLFDKGHSFYTLFISIWSMEVWGWLRILPFRSQKAENRGHAGWIVTESTGLTLAHSHCRQNSVSIFGGCWLAVSQGHLLTAGSCHNPFPCGPWVVHGIYACLFLVKKISAYIASLVTY